jgi:hypothetical protein
MEKINLFDQKERFKFFAIFSQRWSRGNDEEWKLFIILLPVNN